MENMKSTENREDIADTVMETINTEKQKNRLSRD